MAIEERLVRRHILDSDDSIRQQLLNPVDQKHGVAVRKNTANREDVHLGHVFSLLYQAMSSILSFIQSQQPQLIAFLRELVECESPSDDPAAINRFVELMSDRLSAMGTVKTFPGDCVGKHFQCTFRLPGKKKSGQILALGHSDTVWPIGTLATMPWIEEPDRLCGPGVLDMKSGIAFFVFAMKAIQELDLPVARNVVLQLNSDEEIGSPSSRALTEKEAKRSIAVLVLEPGSGLDGKPKTARKGVGDYYVKVRGIAAHAGVDFTSGASAILELARQLEKISTFTNLKRGITVNPGVISGGTRSNVIAEFAGAEIDIRIAKASDFPALDRKFKSLKPFNKRCQLQVTGGLNRPPMERTSGVVKLFKTAKRVAQGIGIKLEESSTGGGSDGNFTAGLGIPTLDGIGGVGEGAHAAHESILTGRIADRAALLGELICVL